MLNKALIAKLSKEIQALYHVSSVSRINNSRLASELRDAVQDARRSYRRRGLSSSATLPAVHHTITVRDANYRGARPGAWAKQQIKELSNRIFTDKAPPTTRLGDWVSVELECICPSQDAEAMFVAWVRSSGNSSYVTVKDDGSLRVNDEDANNEVDHRGGDDCDNGDCDCSPGESCAYGREVVVSFTADSEGYDRLRAVCSTLNKLKFYVNKSCGTHVHFDMRHIVSVRTVATIGKRVGGCVDALRLLLPRSRARNAFCRDKINKLRGGGRYAFVNMQAYHKHRTIEIRGHSGTTDANKIVNWIEIIKTIMYTKGAKPATTIVELLNNYRFGTALMSYMILRNSKFYPVTSPDTAGIEEARTDMFVNAIPSAADDVALDNAEAA